MSTANDDDRRVCYYVIIIACHVVSGITDGSAWDLNFGVQQGGHNLSWGMKLCYNVPLLSRNQHTVGTKLEGVYQQLCNMHRQK